MLKSEVSGEEAEDEEEVNEEEEVEEEEVEKKEVKEEDEEEDEDEEEVVFNFDNICKKMDKTKLSKNTKVSYKGILKNYMYLLPAIEKEDVNTVIDSITIKAKCLETKKAHLNCIVKICELFNLESKSLYSDEIGNVFKSLKIQKMFSREDGYLEIEVATEMMNKLEEQIEILNDIKLKSLLVFIRDYGVLRPSELASIKIYTESIEIEKEKKNENYFCIPNKKLIINCHKTMADTGVRVIEVEDAFLSILTEIGYTNGRYWLVDRLFKDPLKKMNKIISDAMGIVTTIYTLRKMKSSLVLESQDIPLINRTSNVQGHCIDTMISNYSNYRSLKKKLISEK